MPEDGRAPTANVIDQFNTIDCPDMRALGAVDKKGFAANRTKCTHRRIHAAWNPRACACEQVR